MLAVLTASKQSVSVKQWRRFLYPALLLACSLFYLHDYLKDVAVTLLAGIAAIVSTSRKGKGNRQQRFATVALLMFVLTWLVPVKTLLYLAAGFALFYWVETTIARIHFLGVFALLLASPAFQYASSAFSFPIRLQLTKLVGTLFSFVASDIELRGNTIFYGGQEFAVDPACMGIHMLSISLLLGICLLGLLQQKTGRFVSWKMTLLYLACLFLLNLVANVLRIVLLVQFAVPPEAAMHDIIGLMCLLFYVCMPACFLAKKLVSKATPATLLAANLQKSSKKMQWLLLGFFLLVAQRVLTIDTFAQFNTKYTQKVSGYSSSLPAPGILKLENRQTLLYVKFIRGFYDTEHNPSMCWKGSGYTFKDVETQALHGKEVYTATLQKNTEQLYTAWWYGNDEDVITSQAEWRWKMLKESKQYALINITANNEATLSAEIKKLLDKKTLKPLFKQD